MRRFRSEKDVFIAFDKINIWKSIGVRAPNKPLLLLMTLARVQRKESRLAAFEKIEPRLRNLLLQFGPPRKHLHPEYPFWHLQTDGIWEITNSGSDKTLSDHKSMRYSVSAGRLRNARAEGGFSEDLFDQLRDNPDLVNRLAARILDNHFPTSLHQDILDDVGMPWVARQTKRKRDPGFRDMILRIYEHRCAVCSFDGRLGMADLCLEAAHMKWHAAGGPDEPNNGLALCSLHHKALDIGAIGFDENKRIIVSQELNGSHGVSDWFLSFLGKPLRKPQTGQPGLLDKYTAWHRKQVFRAPTRAFQ